MVIAAAKSLLNSSLSSLPTNGPGKPSHAQNSTNGSSIQNTRDSIEALSKPDQINETPINNIETLPATALAPRWFNVLSNLLKNSTSLVLNGLGFVGSGLAFLSYFVFNFKIGSFIFGLPSLMSFYIAFNLKQSLKNSGGAVILDPLKGLQKIISEQGLNQDQDRTIILRYIQDARKLLNAETRKEEVNQVLKAFDSMVKSKIHEVQTRGGSESNKDVIEFKKDLDMYAEALDEIDLNGNN